MIVKLALLLLTVCFTSYASKIIVTENSSFYSDFQVDYFYDEDSNTPFNQLTEAHFAHSIPSQFTLGYREGTLWLRLTIHNQSSNPDFILYLSEPFWGTFDLYEPSPNGWTIHPNGLSTPLHQRQIEDANPAFKLTIYSGETKTFYIKGQTTNAQIGALQLFSEKEFFRPSRLKMDSVYLFYSGILFIILILNLFLLIEMKERIYGYYIGYVTAFIVFISMFSGSYLYFGFAPWQQGLHVVGTIVMTFMALFSMTFLEVKRYFPKLHRTMVMCPFIFLTYGVLIHFHIPYMTLAFNISSTIFLGLILFIAIKTWLIGEIKTRFYLLALIVYMPTMGLMVLTFNAILDNNDFNRYIFLLGALLEIIFFSLILASRFHAAKDETIHFQNALLGEQQKHRQFLESEVIRQQQEIKEKNAILSHQSKNAAMGEMISMIAHQWRQPLNTLALLNQDFYVKSKLGQWSEDLMERTHAQFDENLQYMSKTIDDFRNYYNENHTRQHENLAEIAKLAFRLSEVFLNYANIQTSLLLSATADVYLSKNEMIQVLMNLIKNSHDAIVERKIKNGRIVMTIEDHEGPVVLRLCDNAGGISEEIGKKIFEPYFSTKTINGTGLGLYMSKAIVEEHFGGKLEFENIGDGVCFTITLSKHES